MSLTIKILILVLSSFSGLTRGLDASTFTDDIVARILSLEERDVQQQLFNGKLTDVVDKQKEELQQKDAIIKRLQSEVHDLQTTVTDLEVKLNVLQKNCDDKQEETSQQKAGLPNDGLHAALFGADIKPLLNHNTAQNDTEQTHKQSSKTIGFSGNIHRHSSNLKHSLDTRNTIHSLSKLAVEDVVAFHAVYSGSNDVLDLHVGETILFPTVHLNIGNGYHTQHGLFIAPTNGLYLFSVSIFTLSSHYQGIFVSLMKNNNVLATAFADGDDQSHDQGSVTAVVQLNVGDEVWARNKLVSSSIRGESCTSFTGYMIVAL